MRTASTPAEHKLWLWLHARRFEGFRFRRQHAFAGYILDFYCPELRLAIEVDGAHHADDYASEGDFFRDRSLERVGITVLRIPNELLRRDPVQAEAWIRNAIERAVKRGR